MHVMAETLVERLLSDGSRLWIEKYALTDNAAALLERRIGSEEIVLKLQTDQITYGTRASVSWVLNEDHYRSLYEAIKSEADYKKVERFLENQIESENDVYKIAQLLKQL
jgi:hypothetical protein